MEMDGFDGLEWKTEEGALARKFLRTKGNTIEGGTSEIMLNIIAKRVLGLPNN